MRILHYSSSLSRSAGGLYYSVSGLAKAQKAGGHQVFVIGGADEHFEGDRYQWGGVDLIPTHPLSKYGLSGKALRAIQRIDPDVVHIQGVWSASSIYGRFAQLLGIPVIVSPRGMVDPWILARRSGIKSLHSTLWERPLFRKAWLHALTAQERDAVNLFEPFTVGRTFVIPNGINWDPEVPSGDRKSGALYLGRLHPKKQVLELINAWKKPVFKGCHLTIAGWGDAAYEAEVSRAVAGAENISFVRALYGQAKEDALRKSLFFLLPSLSEGLPMAVLEAISKGCIPVITSSCNLPELFDMRVAQRIESNFSDFEQVMGRLFQKSTSEVSDISIRAHTVSATYSWERIAPVMVEEYDRAINIRK